MFWKAVEYLFRPIPLKGLLPILFFVGLLSAGCSNTSEYRTLVEKELATDVRNDTLLMDLRFGMDKREFFGHCWELNKKGLVGAGIDNTTVHFDLERFGKKYDVNFYPNFHDGKITDLPVKYSYSAFAPWNPKYSLETLLKEVLRMHKEEYGDDFLEIRPRDKDKGIAYVRVDGNRRISIYKNPNKNNVTVFYYDLMSGKESNSNLDDF